MSHGLKSLARELPQYGRGGDSIVAHINPEEAAMLKAMGGSGTINPHTGLPEYLGGFMGKVLGGGAKAVTGAVKSVVQPVYNATLRNIPGVDQGLVGLDKAVGKTIPGGWGTVAQVAASMIPGAQFGLYGLDKAMTLGGMGAVTGSGVLRKGNNFNLQGAIMGGAAAYGMANLAQGMSQAGASQIPAGDIAAANAAPDAIGALNASQAWTGAGAEAASQAAAQTAGTGASNFAYTPSGEMVPSNISADITGAASPVVPEPSALQNFATGYGENVAAAGRGLANLTGMGPEGFAGIAPAASAFGSTGATLTNTAVPLVMGTMGLADIQAQEDYLNQQQSTGAISDTDYNAQMAQINASKAKATSAMEENPYQFAMGGSVQDGETGGDDNYSVGGVPGYFGGGMMFSGLADKIQNDPNFLAKLQNTQQAPTSSGGGFGGGIFRGLSPSLIDKITNSPTLDYKQIAAKAMADNPYKYAEGGMAGGRFLSGGGDGLSDDIPAVIGGKQPAKLADGEFVISSDVVSNLGNGSSKAGAKKLYDMMDRVRKQAHGTTKQIRKVNAKKVLPA